MLITGLSSAAYMHVYLLSFQRAVPRGPNGLGVVRGPPYPSAQELAVMELEKER